MPPVKIRQSNPSHLVEYGEIEIADEKDLGTGSFTVRLKPNALIINNVISCQMVNVPLFQISINVNNQEKEISALLGEADGSDPRSRKEMSLPEDLDLKPAHTFVVSFHDWSIDSVEMDGEVVLCEVAT